MPSLTDVAGIAGMVKLLSNFFFQRLDSTAYGTKPRIGYKTVILSLSDESNIAAHCWGV